MAESEKDTVATIGVFSQKDSDALPTQFFTVAEAAEYLRVSRKKLRRLLAAGQINGIKIGSEWRIPEESLQKYLWDGLRTDLV